MLLISTGVHDGVVQCCRLLKGDVGGQRRSKPDDEQLDLLDFREAWVLARQRHKVIAIFCQRSPHIGVAPTRRSSCPSVEVQIVC
jgi:hypothetical protein